MSFTRRAVDSFNGWVGSYAGFVQSVAATLLWIPLVVYGVDPSGFTYLYIATALSLIGTFSLAIYARRLEGEQKKFEAWLEQMLVNQADTMRALIALAGEIASDQDEILKELEED